MALARVQHRLRQFVGALRPRIDTQLRAEAFGLLRDPERQLFGTMTLRDQQHGLDVYRRLQSRGHDERDLLVAALLHDVGKGRIALWHRVAYVLLEAGSPGLLRRAVKQGEGRTWRHALYRCLHHPELGARMARRAGCSEQVIALIEATEQDGPDEGLVALRAADDSA